MELVKFSNQLGGKDPAAPPFRIPARDLDSNFSKLKPLKLDGNSRQYLLTETPEGWFIKIFPEFPSGPGPFFLAISNGRLYWTGSGVDEPEGETNVTPIGDAPSNGLTYGRKNAAWDRLYVVPAPPSSGTHVLSSQGGTISWLGTEACAT